MNIPTRSRPSLPCLLLTLLGILALTASTGLGALPGAAISQNPLVLLRVDLPGPSDLQRFAESGLPVYAHLFDDQGQPYLLLPADPDQVSRLTSQGFFVTVLDQDAAGASYYLLAARDAAQLRQAGPGVQVLLQEGRQALVKATAQAAERLAGLGIEIVRLERHPLVLPLERPAGYPTDIDPDPTVQEMIDQVLAGSAYNYTAGLSGEFAVMIGGTPYQIFSRYTYTTELIQKATQYVYEHFEGLGLPVSYHYYNLGGIKRNVIAEQAGYDQMERIFIITAHLDSITGDPYNYAPGADDNASGSVGVLMAADILSNYFFDCTIRYALFTGEEQGLVGSYYYAQSAYNNGDNIEGVLNLDMIGYNTLGSDPVIELHTRPSNQDDLAIANLFVDVIDAYGLDLTPQIVQDGISASDHYSFWQVGYPAILGIEDFSDFTPHYHSTGDQVETLDLAYFTNFIKASVGSMGHMGCLIYPGYIEGLVTDLETHDPIPAVDVLAQRSSGHQFLIQSNDNGSYFRKLVPGTYAVTAEMDGYLPFTTGGIEITTDMTTTLDIQLQPCHILGPEFTFTPEAPISGEPVTFTGSIDPASVGEVSYAWDFGDGHSGIGAQVAHTYTVSDTYTVTMTASNCAGSVSIAHPVAVTGTPGIGLSMGSWDAEAAYGQTLTEILEIGNSGEQALSWSLVEQPEVPWLAASVTSGELGFQERQEITLTLQAPLAHGIYTTTLQVLSNDPDQPQVDIPVTLQVACAELAGLDFGYDPAAPRINQPVIFSGGVITGSLPISYTWDFQDGSDLVFLQDDPSGEHIFSSLPAAGAYFVTLSASNACSPAIVAGKELTILPLQVYLPLVQADAP